MFLSVLSPVLEDNPYVTPAIGAGGISDFQKKQLAEMLDSMRKEAKERKAALKAAAKKSKKDAKKAAKDSKGSKGGEEDAAPTSIDGFTDPTGSTVGGSDADIRKT